MRWFKSPFTPPTLVFEGNKIIATAEVATSLTCGKGAISSAASLTHTGSERTNHKEYKQGKRT